MLASPAPAEVVQQPHSRGRLRAGTRGAERKRRRPAATTSASTTSTTIDGATPGCQELPKVGWKDSEMPLVARRKGTATTTATNKIVSHPAGPPMPVALAELHFPTADTSSSRLAFPGRIPLPGFRPLALHLPALPRLAPGLLLPPITLALTATRTGVVSPSARVVPSLRSDAQAAIAAERQQSTSWTMSIPFPVAATSLAVLRFISKGPASPGPLAPSLPPRPGPTPWPGRFRPGSPAARLRLG